ncbi:MAG: hypothetical protein M0Q21_04640 [Ignavibacteriaceae bacterium]|jgi:predicted nuclease of predicted toxin-antitoxin system|nr:hypothetical protein [Ignavibacteriaceae bacterium]
MKLLLDENLPKKLKGDFKEYSVYTVSDKSWNGKKNGELLQLMIEDRFDVLLSFDKNLQHQQNFNKYPITVFLLNAEDNTYLTLQKSVLQVKELLRLPLKNGVTEIKQII